MVQWVFHGTKVFYLENFYRDCFMTKDVEIMSSLYLNFLKDLDLLVISAKGPGGG